MPCRVLPVDRSQSSLNHKGLAVYVPQGSVGRGGMLSADPKLWVVAACPSTLCAAAAGEPAWASGWPGAVAKPNQVFPIARSKATRPRHLTLLATACKRFLAARTKANAKAMINANVYNISHLLV